MGEFGGLRQSQGYLHILHLPGVSTKETHSLSPHRRIHMQSKVNVIMLPLFFFFPEHFVLALICSLPCISIVALHLFPLKTMRKRELCAGFNSICVEICCNICLAAGQVKYSHFIKWRYATVIAHLVSQNDSIYCGALWRCCRPNSANVHVREALA